LIKGFIIAILIVLVPGTIMGLVSAYRAGHLKRDLYPVYLKVKKIAQQNLFNKHTTKHIKSYYMYYGLVLLVVALIVSQ
jgi:hypothetical protein